MIDENEIINANWRNPLLLETIYAFLSNNDATFCLIGIRLILKKILDHRADDFLSANDFIIELEKQNEDEFIHSISKIQEIIARFIFKFQSYLEEIIKNHSRSCLGLEILWAWSCGQKHDNRILSSNDIFDLKKFTINKYPIQLFFWRNHKKLLSGQNPYSEKEILDYLDNKLNQEYLSEQEELEGQVNSKNRLLRNIIIDFQRTDFMLSYYLNGSEKLISKIPVTNEQLQIFLLKEISYPILLCEADPKDAKLIKCITLLNGASQNQILKITQREKKSKAFRNQVKYYIRQFFEASLIQHQKKIGSFKLYPYVDNDFFSEAFSKYVTWTNTFLCENFEGKQLNNFFKIDQDRINYKDSDNGICSYPEIRFEIISNICLIE